MKNLTLSSFFLLFTFLSFGQSSEIEPSEKNNVDYKHNIHIGLGTGIFLGNKVFFKNYIDRDFSGTLRYSYQVAKDVGVGIGGYFDFISTDEQEISDDAGSPSSGGLWGKGAVLLEGNMLFFADRKVQVELGLGIGRGVTIFPEVILGSSTTHHLTRKVGLAKGINLTMNYKVVDRIGLALSFVLIDQSVKITQDEYQRGNTSIYFADIESKEPLFINVSFGTKFFFGKK